MITAKMAADAKKFLGQYHNMVQLIALIAEANVDLSNLEDIDKQIEAKKQELANTSMRVIEVAKELEAAKKAVLNAQHDKHAQVKEAKEYVKATTEAADEAAKVKIADAEAKADALVAGAKADTLQTLAELDRLREQVSNAKTELQAVRTEHQQFLKSIGAA